MALIPPFFLDCVVSIGIKNNNELAWIGTGFIVGRPITDNNDNKTYHCFLITNKHVLGKNKTIYLRFNTIEGNQVKDYPVELEENNRPIWIGHASDDVDVAAFNINPQTLHVDAVQYNFFQLDEHVMLVSDIQQNKLSEGNPLFILGFPMGILFPQNTHSFAISRPGSIARIRDLLINRANHFLIDANIFPGNSGGPVVTCPGVVSIEGTTPYNKASLIGIVKSYVPFIDVAISQQTQRPRITFEENSGLALVETVDSIKETVELFYKK